MIDLIAHCRMKFENGSASPVVLDVRPMPEGGPAKLFAVRVLRTREGETICRHFGPLEEELLAAPPQSYADIERAMGRAGYRRVA